MTTHKHLPYHYHWNTSQAGLNLSDHQTSLMLRRPVLKTTDLCQPCLALRHISSLTSPKLTLTTTAEESPIPPPLETRMSSSTIIPHQRPAKRPPPCPSRVSLLSSRLPLRTLFLGGGLDVDAGQPERVVAALVRVSRRGPRRAAALGDARGEPHRRRGRRRRLWRRLVGRQGRLWRSWYWKLYTRTGQHRCGGRQGHGVRYKGRYRVRCRGRYNAGEDTDSYRNWQDQTRSDTDIESAADGRHGNWTGAEIGKDTWCDGHQLRGRMDRRRVCIPNHKIRKKEGVV